MMRCLPRLLVLAVAVPLPAIEADQALRDLDPPWYDKAHDAWQAPPLPKPLDWDGMSLFSGGSSGLGSLPDLSLLFLYVAVAVAVAVIAVALWRSRWSGRTAGRNVPARQAARILDLPFELAGASSDPDTEIRAAVAAGDYRRACLWSYAALLLDLDRGGRIQLARGHTNNTYVQQLRRAESEFCRPFTARVRRFEAICFGAAAAGDEDLQFFQGLRHRLQAAAAGVPA